MHRYTRESVLEGLKGLKALKARKAALSLSLALFGPYLHDVSPIQCDLQFLFLRLFLLRIFLVISLLICILHCRRNTRETITRITRKLLIRHSRAWRTKVFFFFCQKAANFGHLKAPFQLSHWLNPPSPHPHSIAATSSAGLDDAGVAGCDGLLK